NAVEPTKSEHITVTWPRSAVACGFGIACSAFGGVAAPSSAIALSIFQRSPRTMPRFSGPDPSGREGLRNQCDFQQNAGRTRTCRAFRDSLKFAASAAPYGFQANRSGPVRLRDYHACQHTVSSREYRSIPALGVKLGLSTWPTHHLLQPFGPDHGLTC